MNREVSSSLRTGALVGIIWTIFIFWFLKETDLPTLGIFLIFLMLPVAVGVGIGKFFLLRGRRFLFFLLPPLFVSFGLWELDSAMCAFIDNCADEVSIFFGMMVLSIFIFPLLFFTLIIFAKWPTLSKRVRRFITVGASLTLGFLVLNSLFFVYKQEEAKSIYKMALQAKNVELCEEIHPSIGSRLRNSCIINIAVQLQDISICKRYFSRISDSACLYSVKEGEEIPVD
jgi:hypothetical protein